MFKGFQDTKKQYSHLQFIILLKEDTIVNYTAF